MTTTSLSSATTRSTRLRKVRDVRQVRRRSRHPAAYLRRRVGSATGNLIKKDRARLAVDSRSTAHDPFTSLRSSSSSIDWSQLLGS
jgi:hypothetical protein